MFAEEDGSNTIKHPSHGLKGLSIRRSWLLRYHGIYLPSKSKCIASARRWNVLKSQKFELNRKFDVSRGSIAIWGRSSLDITFSTPTNTPNFQNWRHRPINPPRHETRRRPPDALTPLKPRKLRPPFRQLVLNGRRFQRQHKINNVRQQKTPPKNLRKEKGSWITPKTRIRSNIRNSQIKVIKTWNIERIEEKSNRRAI